MDRFFNILQLLFLIYFSWPLKLSIIRTFNYRHISRFTEQNWPLTALSHIQHLASVIIIEPAHEIMALFVLRKLILQTRMRSHLVGLDVWCLVGPFDFFHTSYVRTAKALARLHECAGSPEPTLVAYMISTIISCAGSITFAGSCSGWYTKPNKYHLKTPDVLTCTLRKSFITMWLNIKQVTYNNACWHLFGSS